MIASFFFVFLVVVVVLSLANKDIIYGWLHSHFGIKGNEKPDYAAKSVYGLPRVTVGIPYNI